MRSNYWEEERFDEEIYRESDQKSDRFLDQMLDQECAGSRMMDSREKKMSTKAKLSLFLFFFGPIYTSSMLRDPKLKHIKK